MRVEDLPKDQHRPYEDMMAMLLGTFFVALGVTFYTHAVLLTGSTAGLALLLSYITSSITGWGFGVYFFAINLPFYYLAVKRMGWSFTLRTFAAIGLVSLFSELTQGWVQFANVPSIYAALMGGALMGIGMLMLFRHRTSLGGINILALYLQDKHGLRAGYVQLAIDGVILLIALTQLPLDRVGYSVLGALTLNLIIALNHKPGRYIGVS
ncbi:YitT family protein [Vreelandella titanicae]|uniref:YitT family protein n=1 Tax=Halomonadaceae TaxID=28256 RepID=UPI0004894CC0|nr:MULTISPECIES: YitT family protein [Halomonas]MCD1585736.1 YitT family protein [Halomonas sp. IOP_14]NAO98762.1 YitT family protein [Halomonas sp. MG34]PKH61422.1 YitT family protein [Halomonas sp. Choline-3u-9]